MKLSHVLLFFALLTPSSLFTTDVICNLFPDSFGTEIMILGIAQDAGYPQIDCKKECCQEVWNDPSKKRYTASIALIDHAARTFFIIDATPDLKYQLQDVTAATGYDLGGILLTHAHMGHYTGLMHLGREAMGSKSVPVYAMPRMKGFLETNGPWSQLVSLGNIELMPMGNGRSITLSENIQVTPHLVPHRDEFSETAGFIIQGINKTGWYIPDIDKWQRWDRDLVKETSKDFLIVDGTFYEDGEIPGRNMSEIPHPFIEETMSLLSSLKENARNRIHFIHFNHTNPVLWNEAIRKAIVSKGFNLCEQGQSMRI